MSDPAPPPPPPPPAGEAPPPAPATAAPVKKRKWDQEDESAAAAAAPAAQPSDDAAAANGATKAAKVEDGSSAGGAAAAAAAAASASAASEGRETPGSAAATEAALAAAARIAAQYNKPTGSATPEVNDPDPAFVKDIDINDSRNRYLLTRGSTQEQVKAETGANVITKGTWLPDRSKASDKDPPLYLHITGSTQAILDAGVAAIEKLLNTELGPLVTNYRERDQQREERAPRERRKWPEEKLPVGLDSLRNFNVRAKIVGPQGLFVKFIQNETSARVQIKGLGSGFIEMDTGRESDEPMHVHISGPEQIMVDRAKELAEDLLVVVREEWHKAKVVMDQFIANQQNPNPPPPAYNNQYQQPPPPPPSSSYSQPAPPPPSGGGVGGPGGYAAPPPSTDAPPAPAGSPNAAASAAQPAQPAGGVAPPLPAGSDTTALVAQAQALAPTIDVSLLQFYAGHTSDPAMIVYYAQMALYYQSQGYTGQQAPGSTTGAAPAAAAAGQSSPPPGSAATAAQMQSMNAYGTPTQDPYAQPQQTAYGQPASGYGQPQGGQGYAASPYQPQGQQSPPRGGRGSYGAMPPPPGL